MSAFIRALPLLLTALRACLAPVIVLLALYHPSPAALGACLVAAFVSDIFDGVVARRIGVATPGLRRLDSAADTLFYGATAFVVWHLHRSAITERVAPLAVLIALELARYALDWARFRREASYHMWSSKLWGIALLVGLFGLLALGRSGIWVSIAIYAGIVADVEGIAISLVLTEWRSDVPTLHHALRLRRAAVQTGGSRTS